VHPWLICTTISQPFSGTINANSELLDATNGRAIATLSGDNLAATFIDGHRATVTVTGRRNF